MQNIAWKLFLIAVILAACLLSVVVKDLRFGKDLSGGVSLVYKVEMPPGTRAGEAQSILTRTISVLKDRVNPQGILDISMQPLGRDRIEVVMPLPNKEVQELARRFQDALEELLKRSEIRAGHLDDALTQGVAPEQLGGSADSERGQLVAELQRVYDAYVGSLRAYEAGKAEEAAEEDLLALADEVAVAEIDYDALYQEVLGLSLGEPRVRRVLALPTDPQKLQEENPDGTTTDVVDEDGAPVMGPSQRENALSNIKSDYPHLVALIDELVAAHDAYESKRTGFDDPEDLMRLMRGAGVLEFHIAVSPNEAQALDVDDLRAQLEELGPENTSSTVARWYPINELKQWYDTPDDLTYLEGDPIHYFSGRRGLVAAVYQGTHYLLQYVTDEKSMTHRGGHSWSVTQAYPTSDRMGRPAVAFVLDAAGGSKMGKLTAAHLRKPMAIVLDGEVYSAPVIQSQINTNGQITGNFSQEEISYLIKVLAAGSLQARLSSEPISISILGPSLGADNLRKGRDAFIISIIAVTAFMIFYYFFAGFVADLALIANGIIIFGVMIGIDGTFTLPGLAGIVLTIGMAVDANVLIYERIREEIFSGEYDLRGAIRQGYRKALSTILDANITNLIVCFVLFRTATTEVKGFALTLTIGIVATLFTALFVTRQVYYLYTDLAKIRRLPMLATVFPAIHRALEPNINWIGLRKVFWVFSGLALIGAAALVMHRGVDMFDTEFRGGVSLTMLSATVDDDADGEPDIDPDTGEPAHLWLRHTGSPDSVEQRIHAIGDRADPAAATTEQEQTRQIILREMSNASVLTVGDTITDAEGNEQAYRFQVKVSSPKGLDDDRTITDAVTVAIVEEFGDQLNVTRPLEFDGAANPDSTPYVFPIEEAELGKNIDRPQATQRVSDFLGGAAIMLTNVDPPTTPQDVHDRIERMRRQPDFARYGARDTKVYGLTPADPDDASKGYTDLVVLVYDPFRSYLKIESEVWYEDVADAEWRLISEALQEPASLEQVSSFSSAVAETLSAQAIVAVVLSLLGILVYIWVRFGSLRYSVAAIVALVHDVTIALGLLALSGVVGVTAIGSALLIEPFRIDLGVVAALLTIIGYSLNDTIVILDRIRENRGKLPLPTAPVVNNSINQTVSRTLLTSVTTLMAVVIMYAEGGSGIRPFTFCLLVGIFVGTYSSVAIAAPLVYSGKEGPRPAREEAPGAIEETEPAPAG